jgi:hypothetical protein
MTSFPPPILPPLTTVDPDWPLNADQLVAVAARSRTHNGARERLLAFADHNTTDTELRSDIRQLLTVSYFAFLFSAAATITGLATTVLRQTFADTLTVAATVLVADAIIHRARRWRWDSRHTTTRLAAAAVAYTGRATIAAATIIGSGQATIVLSLWACALLLRSATAWGDRRSGLTALINTVRTISHNVTPAPSAVTLTDATH